MIDMGAGRPVDAVPAFTFHHVDEAIGGIDGIDEVPERARKRSVPCAIAPVMPSALSERIRGASEHVLRLRRINDSQ